MEPSGSVWRSGGMTSEPKPQPEISGTSESPPDTSPPESTATATASATPEAAPLPAVDFVEGTPAAAPEKAPTIAITAPTANQVIPADKAGDFEVKLDLKGWEVPANGNHVHVILDVNGYFE